VPDSAFSGLTSYTYDAISGAGTRSQLVQEVSTRAGGFTNAFDYDGGSYGATSGVGNVTQSSTAGVLSFNADNQINSNTYDGNGNPVSYFGSTMTYDPENRLTGDSANGGEVNAYDAEGHRIATAAGAAAYFIFDGDTPVFQLSSDGSLSSTTTYGTDGVISNHGSGASFYLWDPQGSLSQKVSASGNQLYARMYATFGSVIKSDSDSDIHSGLCGQYGYLADNSGLYQLGQRFYDPAIGRFVTRDPRGYAGGTNLYAYCDNNPVTNADPSGLTPHAEPGCKEAANVNAGCGLACRIIDRAQFKKGGDGLCINPKEKRCLQALCRRDLVVSCGSGISDGNGNKHFGCMDPKWVQVYGAMPDGYTDTKTCHITLCTSRIGNSARFSKGLNDAVSNIAETMIHEMMHCCGRSDNGGPSESGEDSNGSFYEPDTNPADDAARCCMGLGPPYMAGYGPK